MMDKIVTMGGKIWGYMVIVVLLSACEDSLLSIDNLAPGDAIVFGHFYGECLGEGCIEIYQLTKNQLWEDLNDQYPSADRPYNGSFIPLSDQQFQHANVLWNSIPTQLFLDDNGVIGSPDAGDWGGIYLEIKVGDSRRFWLIDQKEDNLPSYLVPFKDQINDIIFRINQ